jgi:hypothetical protein
MSGRNRFCSSINQLISLIVCTRQAETREEFLSYELLKETKKAVDIVAMVEDFLDSSSLSWGFLEVTCTASSSAMLGKNQISEVTWKQKHTWSPFVAFFVDILWHWTVPCCLKDVLNVVQPANLIWTETCIESRAHSSVRWGWIGTHHTYTSHRSAPIANSEGSDQGVEFRNLRGRVNK